MHLQQEIDEEFQCIDRKPLQCSNHIEIAIGLKHVVHFFEIIREIVKGVYNKERKYLLPTDNSSGLSLDDHVLCATEVESSRSQKSRLIKILHYASNLFRLKLQIGIKRPLQLTIVSLTKVEEEAIVDSKLTSQFFSKKEQCYNNEANY